MADSEMFRPSAEVAKAIASQYDASRQRGRGKLRRLTGGTNGTGEAVVESRPDAHSQNAPSLDSDADEEQIKAAMGEEIDRLLGSMSLEIGTMAPGTTRCIMSSNRRFEAPIAAALAERFKLANAAAFERLSADFYDWVTKNKEGSARRGLQVNSDGSIDITGGSIAPALTPLDPLESE